MKTVIEPSVIDGIMQELEIKDIQTASIRQVGALVRKAEQQTGTEYIHFEMGIPGLPPSAIGVQAECEALQKGVASQYPIIDGIPALKQEASNISNVIFTGKLSPEDLEKEYREANVFVLPAIVDSKGDTEGLGVGLIEAVENDLVLVASNVGGIPDVVIHNKTGILVNQKNPQELADAFTTLAKDPELCNRLVQGAKEHVQKNFSWDAIIEKQLALYHKILKRKNSPENSEE